MRTSISLACLLPALIAGVTEAQRPNACRNSYQSYSRQSTFTVAQAPSCFRTCPQPAYAVSQANAPSVPAHSQGLPCVANYRVVQSYPVVQSCRTVQSIAVSPTQAWSIVPQPAVTTEPAFANCKCNGATFSQTSPQFSPQETSILENPQNPFSLAGHARPSSKEPTDHCLQHFLNCCENGGKKCLLDYVNCTQITGEPLEYRICPSETPPDEKGTQK